MERTVSIKTGKVQPVEKIWLSREETTAFLGCTERFLRDLKDSGEISYSKYKGTIWYNLDSLKRFLNRHKIV